MLLGAPGIATGAFDSRLEAIVSRLEVIATVFVLAKTRSLICSWEGMELDSLMRLIFLLLVR